MSDKQNLVQQNQELMILNAVAAALNTENDLVSMLTTVLETIADVMPVKTGWVWLLHEETGATYLAASYNLPPALTDYPERMYGTCYCIDVFDEGRLDKTEHYSNITCTRLKNVKQGTRGLRYHASAPLTRCGKRLGIMNLTVEDLQPWTNSQLQLMNTIADMLSVAIERARLFDKSVALGAAEERNRIAREMHDTIAQGIAGIALRIETADALLEAGATTEKVRRTLAHALELTRANMEEARRSVMDLRAAPLEGRALADALTRLAKSEAETTGLKVNCYIVGESQPLPVRLEVGLYRIAQEAIANVVQHAKANHLSVALVAMPEEVTLTIDDDGNGAGVFVSPSGHFGLIGMNERAKLLGGQLTIGRNEAGGTKVQVVVPLEDKNGEQA